MKSTIRKIIPRQGKKRSVGYIKNLNGGKDIVFFENNVLGGQMLALKEGDRVEFDLLDKSNIAQNIRRLPACKTLSSGERPMSGTGAPAGSYRSLTAPVDLKAAVLDALCDTRTHTDWAKFESETEVVLRLLGIHDLYPYDRDNQKGKPDGFFTVGHLAVLYDCTLESDFEKRKSAQIKNFINALHRDPTVTVNYKTPDGKQAKKMFENAGRTREVWIITQAPGDSVVLTEFENVRVKAVPIARLKALAALRLQSGKMDENDLCRHLVDV